MRVGDALDRSLDDVTVVLCFSEDFVPRMVRIIVMDTTLKDSSHRRAGDIVL